MHGSLQHDVTATLTRRAGRMNGMSLEADEIFPEREFSALIQESLAKGVTVMERVTHQDVMEQFAKLYREVFSHDGYGEIRLEMKILRRGQKEVIIHCGKQYRFVVDFANKPGPE